MTVDFDPHTESFFRTAKGRVMNVRQIPFFLALAGFLSAAMGCAGVGPEQAPVLAYAFNVKSQDVTVIDTATNQVVETRPLGAGVRWLSNEQDFWDGRHIWTYDLVDGVVHVIAIDPVEMRVVRSLEVGKGPAHSVQLTPDRRHLLVNAAGDDIVAVIDRERLEIVHRIATGDFPCDIDLAADRGLGYFPERDQHTVAAFDLSTWEIVNRIALPEGSNPHMLRVDPRGETVWVQTAAGGTNDVLDADNLAVRDSRKLGNVPVTTAWTPDGRHAYVTHFRDDFIAVMDAKSYDEVKRIGVGQGVANVAFRPDGRFAYATMPGENKVAVIDTATMEVVKTLPAGDQPFGLIVMPRPGAPGT